MFPPLPAKAAWTQAQMNGDACWGPAAEVLNGLNLSMKKSVACAPVFERRDAVMISCQNKPRARFAGNGPDSLAHVLRILVPELENDPRAKPFDSGRPLAGRRQTRMPMSGQERRGP